MLTGLVIAGFAAQLSLGGSTLPVMIRLGSLHVPRVVGEYETWRLITSAFLHHGWIHLIFNLVALVQLVALVELLYGSARALAFYMVCGLVAQLTSVWMSPELTIGSAGASGALFGFVGLLLGLALYGEPRWRATLVWVVRPLVFSIAFAFFGGGLLLWLGMPMQFDNWAHLGGLVSGLVLAVIFRNPAVPVTHLDRWIAAGALGLLLGAVGSMVQHGDEALETLPSDFMAMADERLEDLSGTGRALWLYAMVKGYQDAGGDDSVEVLHQRLGDEPAEVLQTLSALLQTTPLEPDPIRMVAEQWVLVDPEGASALNALAWMLLTDPDEDVRDPARALRLVDKALSSLHLVEDVSPDTRQLMRAAMLDTRAEARIQLGHWVRALEDQQLAVALGKEGDADTLAEMQVRLDVIRTHFAEE
jgi:membrane associated rhomboid family serine protease